MIFSTYMEECRVMKSSYQSFKNLGKTSKGKIFVLIYKKKKKKSSLFFSTKTGLKTGLLMHWDCFLKFSGPDPTWKNWWVSLHYTRLLYHVFKPSLLRRLFNIRNKLLHHKILFQCTSWNKLLTVGPGLLPIMKDSVQCILNMQLCSPFFKISKK